MPDETDLRAAAERLHRTLREIDAVERRMSATLGEVARLEKELEDARARGAASRRLDALRRRVDEARSRHDDTVRDLDALRTHSDRLRDDLDEIVVPLDDPLAAFEGDVPIALLPVRLETRFTDDGLRVRIYPDVIHVDGHEALLTAEEQAYGEAWWTARWNDEAPVDALWQHALEGRRPARVAWVLEQTRPRLEADDRFGVAEPRFPEQELRPAGPTRAPRARLLPSRWLLVGYRDGEEVLRRWSRTVAEPLALGVAPETEPDDEDERPDEQQALAVDDDLRWFADYDRAVEAGMAVTVATSEVDGGLGGGLDRLLVLGVAHRSDPAAGAEELETALEAHRFTAGLEHVPTGTPTNADDEDAVDARPVPGVPAQRADAVGPGPAAVAAAGALGLDPGGTLGHVGGGDADPDARAEDLHTVLWEATLGYFLRQIMDPVVADGQVDDVRDHFRRHVRPRGPLPVLRVGHQPYGLLPATALARHVGTDDAERLLTSSLRAGRLLWEWPSRGALQLGASGDPGADLVRLLERTSRSATWRMREVFGPGVAANTEGLDDLHGFQQFAALLVLGMIGVPGRPAIVDMTLADDQAVLPVPLVAASPSDEALADDYIGRVVRNVSRRGGYASLSGDPSDSGTLLEALLVHSANLEVLKAATAVVVDRLDLDLTVGAALRDREIDLRAVREQPDVPRAPRRTARRTEISVERAGTADERLSVDPVELAKRPVRSISGGLTLADWVVEQPDAELMRIPQTRQLSEFRASLRRLVGAPTRELHNGTADALDAVAHRYDAWVTSLATRRLTDLRDGGVEGLHVGAFGWVEDLRPSRDAASHGHVHAPSLPQAATAAILRSGHLARGEEAGGALSIDLSSRRVRAALKLVDGMREGQSLAALLGYRFERALRDRDVELARYILPVRQEHPLPADVDRDAGPVEAVAARNVVDGLALAELDAAGRTALFTAAGIDQSDHQDEVGELIDDLADAVDAIGDLLLAESVHQVVLGSSERAAAALDALDRQRPIPDIQVARTPRTGVGVNHRLLLVLDDARPPTAWQGMTDPRSRAAPRVNAWVARVLGEPDRYRFAADVVDGEGAVLETVEAGLRDLGVSPLSALLAAVRGGGEVSELEERLSLAFADAASQEGAAGLSAHEGPPPGAHAGTVGLSEFMLVAGRIADLLSSARGATLRDLAPDTERVESGIDVPELSARADRVRSDLEAVAGLGPAGLTPARLRRHLRSAADLGIRGAVPRGDDGLRDQLAAAVGTAQGLLARLDELESGFDEASAASDDVRARHHTARIQIVLGEEAPVVPRVAVGGPLRAALSTSAADGALLDGAPLAATEFLLDHSRVRPSVGRLWEVLTWGELAATGVDATQVVVAQIPHRPGAPWVGRPLDHPGEVPDATTSLVIHRTAEDDARTTIGSTLHALVVDRWHERIPSPEETTGVAFHYDAPGARPPQSILLAVPPDPDADTWELDTLIDIVNESFDLTRMRMLDMDDLTAAGRVLPAAYLAFNLERTVPSFDLRAVLDAAVRHGRLLEVDL